MQPMLKNVANLIDEAQRSRIPVSAVMIAHEIQESGENQETILARMHSRYVVMCQAIRRGITGVTSHSGMTGGDAKRLYESIQRGQLLMDQTTARAICYAVATGEVNASMGIICAAPTAGASGVLPAVMLAVQEKYGLPEDQVVRCLFTAGAFGYIIANNAFISGAAGGCQAEIGVAAAMTAAAVTELAGGSPVQTAHAMALALKNMLGLTCDPLAGLVEVPCIKRNAAGAVVALTAAEMALAGVESKVAWDDVVTAMYHTGLMLPTALKETSTGGLAATATGDTWRQALRNMDPGISSEPEENI
jgi:L-serine dehydratase